MMADEVAYDVGAEDVERRIDPTILRPAPGETILATAMLFAAETGYDDRA